jgi:alkyldihydroxyacetonephosphate synthase
MEQTKVVEFFEEKLGKDRVLTEESILQEYATDITGLRMVQKHFGWKSESLATCILKIHTKEEASEIIQFLNREKIVSIPRTGGSGVCLGLETPAQSVVLDLSEMNRIVKIDEENLAVTTQAGVPLQVLEETLDKMGYTTGHFPQSLPLAQMGGLVATRSIGQLSTKYGGIEDLLIGVEGVLPDGSITKIKNIPRKSTGPDLRHIWLGSEGALGIITELTVKIFKKSPERVMQAFAIKDFKDGLTIIKEIIQSDWKPAVTRLHDGTEAAESYGPFVKDGESIMLFLSDGPEGVAALEAKAIETTALKYGARPLGSKPLEIWLVHRNDICDHLDMYATQGAVADTCEISAMWSDIGPIYDEVIKRVSAEVPHLVAVTGHSSHSYTQGTNIYFMFGAMCAPSVEEAKKIYDQLFGIIMETTLKYNGSICHHHGVGRYRAQWMKKELGTAYTMLEKIKKAFDPNEIMNKGVLLQQD